jgi:hypothetical protein
MVESSRELFQAELITDAFRMVGWLELPPVHARLADLLNFRDEPIIVLHDLELNTLGSEADKVFKLPMAQIRREAIVLAIPHERRAPPEEDQALLDYVVKVPHRVSFLLPGFTVVGDFYLAREANIAAASPMRGSGFVPLTDAEATYLPDPTLVWKVPVMVVNAARVEAFSPSADLSLP